MGWVTREVRLRLLLRPLKDERNGRASILTLYQQWRGSLTTRNMAEMAVATSLFTQPSVLLRHRSNAATAWATAMDDGRGPIEKARRNTLSCEGCEGCKVPRKARLNRSAERRQSSRGTTLPSVSSHMRQPLPVEAQPFFPSTFGHFVRGGTGVEVWFLYR